MRVKNSIKNIITSFSSNLIVILLGLLSQAIFIKILGKEYLGINGLFNNIVSMLAIVELGIGSAIIYNLYKPVAENDQPKIKALMNFYKKCYNIISIIILLIGLSITPFLNFFATDVTVDVNLEFIYILFILDVFASYLLSYKRSIINANQKNFIVNIVHIGYLVILNLLQIAILILTKNYYLYLGIKIVLRLLENVVLSIIATKLYPYLNNNKEELDEVTKKDIFQKVRALFFHKIGGFLVLGTDNIIISKYLGIVTVGLYSNYNLIIDAVSKLFGQVINVLTPSVGNLLTENNKKKTFDVFKRVRFLNFWIATFSGISILVIINSFISVWVGKEFILPTFVLIILILNYFQKSMRSSYSVFKEAAGIYHEDRFVPIIESVLNIVSSIILLHYFDLAGVFMGTIISGLALWCYSYPKFVYKKLFDRSYKDYIKETLEYILVFILIAGITFSISYFINIENQVILLLLNILLSLLLPNIALIIIYRNNENFKYYLNLLKQFLRRKKV